MRASSVCHVVLTRFGFWRAGIATICGLGAFAIAAWLLAAQAVSDGRVLLGCAAVLAVTSACGASLVRVRPVTLRWDGQAWFLGPADVATIDPVRGELAVCIDLGAWMLLRFSPNGARRPFRVWFSAVWLPVQRRGLEPQWHALRCAAFAPRVSSRGPGMTDLSS